MFLTCQALFIIIKLIINYYHLTDVENKTVKRKHSDFFLLPCRKKPSSSLLCFFPLSLHHYSRRTLLTFLVTICVEVFPHTNK